MANINITTEELKKVLQGTEMSYKHFLARLSNIKMDRYKTEKKRDKSEKEEVAVIS